MIKLDCSRLNQLFPQAKPIVAELDITNVVIDSRLSCGHSLFVAIRGENFDGHDYIAAAKQKGALAALVEHRVDVSIPQFEVKDTRQALAKLANAWVRELNPTVIAITGSNGKTTVKEMLAHILSSHSGTHKTAGNLNNDIGVPLTLFKLTREHRFAVIEMGANHANEIKQLLTIAEPDVVYVNNAQAAHVEGFGSMQNIVKAKGEMYRFCKNSAIAVFNEDQAAFEFWKSSCSAKQSLGFSLKHSTDVDASFDIKPEGISLKVTYQDRQVRCLLKLRGEHNVQNALAAITLAIASGLSLDQACAGLSGFAGVQGRQQFVEGINNSLIIDDTYNANPDSLAAAIKVLCALPGDAWLALGDMAELGSDSQLLHDQSVLNAQQAGVKKFFALGKYSCAAAKRYGDQGFCFTDHAAMASHLALKLEQGVNLLVKGSRSAHMEKLVSALTAQRAPSNVSGGAHAV